MPAIVDHEKRRLDMMNEFMGIFAHKGYKDTRISDIKGYSRTLIYKEFYDKADIFYSIVKEIDKLPDLYNKGRFLYEFKDKFDEEIAEQIQRDMNDMYVRLGEMMTDV